VPRLDSRDRRRVLLLVENISVPFDRRVRQEAVALHEAGYEVVVISPVGPPPDHEPFQRWNGIEIHRYPLAMSDGSALGYVREYLSAFLGIRRLVRRVSKGRAFGVVHAANPPDFLLVAALRLKWRGARFVFDHHDLAPELYEARFGRRDAVHWILRRVERLAFVLADLVIATNESHRRVALERGGRRRESVVVVRNGPDLDRFRAAEPDASVRGDRPFLIAYLGLMGSQDGLDVAMRVLAELRTTRDDWRAVFMGDGDVLDDTKALAVQLDLAGVVEFTGRVGDDRILPILSAAEVCIAPEPSTPFNDRATIVKVLEYMAMARPVVAFDLPETRLSAGDAALYAPPGDEAAFARCIARLLDDSALRSELGRRGRERVEQELGWHRGRGALLAAYAALLEV